MIQITFYCWFFFSFGQTAGGALVRNPDVHKIAFTGSTSVGQLILTNMFAKDIKRVTMELGGKSPLIVFNDADCT